MQHKDGQTLRGLAILLLSIQGLLDGDGGQCAGELDQHRRQQRQLILALCEYPLGPAYALTARALAYV